MAEYRRSRQLETLQFTEGENSPARLDRNDFQQLAEDGFLVKRNFLPDDSFKQLLEEVRCQSFSTWEMRQG